MAAKSLLSGGGVFEIVLTEAGSRSGDVEDGKGGRREEAVAQDEAGDSIGRRRWWLLK